MSTQLQPQPLLNCLIFDNETNLNQQMKWSCIKLTKTHYICVLTMYTYISSPQTKNVDYLYFILYLSYIIGISSKPCVQLSTCICILFIIYQKKSFVNKSCAAYIVVQRVVAVCWENVRIRL